MYWQFGTWCWRTIYILCISNCFRSIFSICLWINFNEILHTYRELSTISSYNSLLISDGYDQGYWKLFSLQHFQWLTPVWCLRSQKHRQDDVVWTLVLWCEKLVVYWGIPIGKQGKHYEKKFFSIILQLKLIHNQMQENWLKKLKIQIISSASTSRTSGQSLYI